MMPTRSIAALLPLFAVAAACTAKKDDSFLKQLKDMSQSTNSNGAATEGDPCSLLDPSEVAAAIGPLASAPYRGEWKPDQGNNSCRYDTKDHRRIVLSVDWSGGPIVMKMNRFGRGLTDQVSKQGEMKMGKTVLGSGDTLAGEWDEISEGPMACCDLHVLLGDRHLELNWTGTRLTAATAAPLLNAALKRLDHPLAINGSAGIPAAQQNYAADAKDSTVDMCKLIPQADAEAILGAHLLNPPARGQAPGAAGARECDYKTPMPGGGQVEYDLILWTWHDGAVQFGEDQFVIAGGTRAVRNLAGARSGALPADTTDNPAGPWDEAGPTSSMGFEAVTGPIMVKLNTNGSRQTTLALLGKAITTLKAGQ